MNAWIVGILLTFAAHSWCILPDSEMHLVPVGIAEVQIPNSLNNPVFDGDLGDGKIVFTLRDDEDISIRGIYLAIHWSNDDFRAESLLPTPFYSIVNKVNLEQQSVFSGTSAVLQRYSISVISPNGRIALDTLISVQFTSANSGRSYAVTGLQKKPISEELLIQIASSLKD